MRATTLTPSRVRIAELVLRDEDLEQELRRLRLFDEGDVYQAPENQIEYTVGVLEVRLQSAGAAASYQFGINNLENASSLLIESDFFDEEEDRDHDRFGLAGEGENGPVVILVHLAPEEVRPGHALGDTENSE